MSLHCRVDVVRLFDKHAHTTSFRALDNKEPEAESISLRVFVAALLSPFLWVGSLHLPVHSEVPVEGHKVHLAGGGTVNAGEEHFIVPFTQELQSLRSLVHEHPIQVARFHRTYLDCFLAPSHDLT